MYRAYENPRSLEQELAKAKEREEKLRRMLRETESFSTMEEVYEDLVELHHTISDLEQRINHAWQDEYEEG